MGRPKLLLPWGTTTVLQHIIEQWRSMRAIELTVVLAAENHALSNALDNVGAQSLHRVFNPAPEQGMFSSVRCAAGWRGWNSNLTHIALLLGDQPHLPTRALQELLVFAAHHHECIVQPALRSRARHPVIFPRAIFAQLGESKLPTLKEFLVEHGNLVMLWPTAEPAFAFDLDTPADYERLRQQFPPPV